LEDLDAEVKINSEWVTIRQSIKISAKESIRKVQKYQVGLNFNGKHQHLAYADDVNLLGDNTDNIKKNIETLIDASKEVGLEINVEETKYCTRY
jgi:hypothetical protein